MARKSLGKINIQIIILIFSWPLPSSQSPHMLAAEALAKNGSKSVAETGERHSGKASESLSRETELRVEELVESHLPALKAVLDRLRSVQPQEYNRAIRDLARSARKLEIAKNRDDRFFEVELELLQAQTETTLLLAKLKIRDNPSDKQRLKNAASRLQQAQLERAEYDVTASQQRLERAQQQLKAAEQRLAEQKAKSDEAFEKSFATMLRKIGRTNAKATESEKDESRDSDSGRLSSRKTKSDESRSPSR